MAARGFIGAGDIYIERMVGGVAQGLKGPYFADKFEIKPNVEVKENTSKGRNTYGQVLDSVAIQQPADFTLDLKEVNKESLTINLLGTEVVSTVVSGALPTTEFTAPSAGDWFEIGVGDIAPVLSVTDSAGVETYVEGTDYEVNRPLGYIRFLAGGDVAPGDKFKLAGTTLGHTGALIKGATNTEIRARIVFDGINQADGLPVIVTIHEAIIAADSAFDFLADDFNVVSLPGKLKTPVGKTEPFTVLLKNAA